MAISTAVGLDRISRVVGYELGSVNLQVVSPYLPQRVAILAEANTDKQSTLTPDKGVEVTSAQEAGELYGFGSPIHQIMRILRPISGGGIGGIPTIIYPQETAVGATAATSEITVTGTATKAGTHYMVINGRDNIDGQPYAINIVTGDDATAIAVKIKNAINAVLGSPVSADNTAGVVTLTTKWKGATAAELTVEVDMNNAAVGVTYAVGATAGGTGVISLTDTLAEFASVWNTIVVNSYGTAQFATLEAFNGVPGIGTSTGRYEPITFKPFIALWGSKEDDKDDLATITDAAARKDQVTNVLCPAPLSKGYSWEAAANGCFIVAPIFQSTPNIDVNGRSYPDMPVPTDGNIGDMAFYDNRDFLVKKGCSTVTIANGKYVFEDFVTTYHPASDIEAKFRYARNLNIHWNFRFAYLVAELTYVVNKTLVNDSDFVTAANTIKPKDWKQIVLSIVKDFVSKALLADAEYTKGTLQVGISSINPDRFETKLNYKTTGIARISSTTVAAGFNYGTV